LWEKSFPQINGALPVWNVGALTFWWPGHFRTSGAIDLFVNTRRRLMHSDVGQTTAYKHVLADLDGDSRLEIASAGYGDGVRLIDPRIGKVLWSLPAPTGPRVTSVNIDGQGGDEIIYPAGNTLVAVTGDCTSGRILWTWQGPTSLSLPAIADMDGDGSAEILVQDANATLHCLAAAAPP